MAYIPGYAPEVTSVDELRRFVEREFQEFAKSLQETIAVDLRPINAEPNRPRTGMIVYADGVDWDPTGEGPGIYQYLEGNWSKLGANGLVHAIVAGNGLEVDSSDPEYPIIGIKLRSSQTVTAATATLATTARDVLVNRVGNVALTLPAANGTGGHTLRIADISTPSPDHTITLIASGTDTIVGGNPNFELYHNGTDAPRVELWPIASNGLWVVK